MVTVGREDTPLGEVALRRRGEVLELIVNGAFAMDTVDVSTEVALAERALALHPDPRRVLVGGLGLGFTARAVLADPRVDHLVVVDVAEPLVRWSRQGRVPELAGIEGPRCTLCHADIVDVLTGRSGPAGPWDVVVLDVDNGPDFLIHAHNAELYQSPLLASARQRLAGGGVLVIWSSHPAPGLLAALQAAAGPGDRVAETLLPVRRQGRAFDYALYCLVVDPEAGSPVSGCPQGFAP